MSPTGKPDKTASDFVASVRVLEANLDLFRNGLIDAYRPLATELRKLLCDREPLLPRVFVEVWLHKLQSTEMLENEPNGGHGRISYFGSTSLTVTKHVTHATLDLARSGARLPCQDWVQQPFLRPGGTLWGFIKSVADKESVHSDSEPDDTLRFIDFIKYSKDPSRAHEVAALAEYIARFLRMEDLEVRAGVAVQRAALGEPWELSSGS